MDEPSTPSRARREREVFEAVLDAPAEERDRILELACGDDAALRRRVVRLLEAHDLAAGLPTQGMAGPAGPDHPERIGPYRILQPVGEGGMGTVYVAEQTEPVRRHVAVKLIKAGLDTREVIARFEAERRHLALMNHASIARILDAGTTEQGRPYFVMEYVPGRSIVDYCRRENTPLAQRLQLFEQVCRAVQHAHQKGVIHRDLKPSNILITEEDGVPLPKVIDFGIAKATHGHGTDEPLQTRYGTLIGTPDYASPEQAEMSSLEVDTRADVYSLGVVLYELLSDARPFDFSGVLPDEVQRILREVDPPRPSRRAAEAGLPHAAAVRGELDWIVGRALAKDRSRRYQTTLALAEDLERYRHKRPVEAGPPGTAYRLRVFVRRHATALTLAGWVAALVAAVVTFYTYRLTVERNRANAEARAAEQARAAAEQVSTFLIELFDGADPTRAGADSVTLRALLEQGRERIARDLDGQPLVRARLMETMGRVHLSLGEYDAAGTLLDSALQLRREALGSQHSETASARYHRAAWLAASGAYEEAIGELQQVLELQRQALGDSHPAVASSLLLLGSTEIDAGRFEAAETTLRDAVQRLRRLHAGNDLELATAINALGTALKKRGDNVRAEPLYREALLMRRALLGDRHTEVASTRSDLATLLAEIGRPEEAKRLYLLARESMQAALGPGHEYVATLLSNQAGVEKSLGQYAEAEGHYREAIEILRGAFGSEHPKLATAINNLATLHIAQGRTAEAERLMRDVLAMRARLLEPDHPSLATARYNLASTLMGQQRFAEAAPLLAEALDSLRASIGVDHWRYAFILARQGECWTGLRRWDEAEQALLESVATLRRGLGDDHERTQQAILLTCRLYEAQGDRDELARFRALLTDPSQR